MEAPLWQTTSWERFQKELGHETLRLKRLSQQPLMIIHPLFFGLKYGYIPRGPQLHENERGTFEDAIRKIARKKKLIFTRIDPPEKIPGLKGKPSESIQPNTSIVIDLSLSEEEILKQMKRKGRYNIKLAQKKGVAIQMAKDELERKSFTHAFHNLLIETTERDQFYMHSEDYYQKMLSSLPESEIFLAFYEDRAIAGMIATFQQEEAIYYYGASSNEHREVMAPYLLQWEAILEAKQRGCKQYDFLGIAPESAEETHPWYGITRFKKKFGGQVQHYPQALDIVHKSLWYKLYKIIKVIQKLIK